MSGKIVMVTGGSRSGKSEFAERYVLHNAEKCAYIATAEILDDEMAERVALHQRRRRNGRWLNYEAPYDADKVMASLPEEADAVLFDCLTIYMCNLFYGKNAPEGEFLERCAVVLQQIDALIEAARKSGKIVVFVTNEVGCGIVPGEKMSREYRDLAGWVNQSVGAAADELYLCVCGQAIDMKKLAYNIEEN